jgi:kynurenine formamidase
MDVTSDELTYEPLLERDGVRVSRSPWGPDDEIGRLNWITPETSLELLARTGGGRIFDLSVDYFMGMPSFQAFGDPPYQIWMTHTPHGTIADDASGMGPDVHRKYSYCGDAVSMYTHLGTHIDTLIHLGYYDHYWNGFNAEAHLGSRAWTVGGADKYPPLIARGVVLDVAALHGVDRVPDDLVIGPDDLRAAASRQGVELRRGDIVLIRTGKMQVWPAPAYLDMPMPGINLAAARYLCEEAGAMIIGADTAALEAFPGHEEGYAPVHCYMFATTGTPIMEVVNLEELAGEGVDEFVFVGMPLPLRGATGSPLRPIAIPFARQ